MEGKLLIAIAVILLFTPPVVLAQSVTVTSKPPIGLGFNPATVEHVSHETPRYTTGDSLWVESYSTDVLTVIVNSPRGAVNLVDYLQPDGLANLHTFSTSDLPGNWSVSVFDQTTGAIEDTAFSLVNSTQILIPRLSAANITGSILELHYTLPPTTVYGIQACALGTTYGPTSTFELPLSLGTSLEVTLNGTTVTEKAPGLKATASAWTELYTARSYQNGTTLLSEETLAAQTEVATAYGAPLKEPLTTELNLRAGRYDLRSYLRSPAGLLLFEASFLKTEEGRWVSLQGCSALAPVNSDSFVVGSGLAQPTSTWPRSILLMYTDDGVDAETWSNITTQVARVELMTNSAGQVPEVQGRASGSGIVSWGSSNSSVYLIGESFPLQAQIEVLYGGLASKLFNLTMPSPFDVYHLGAPYGVLVLQTSLNGSPVRNATIDLEGQNNQTIPFRTNSAGNISLTLPPGNYVLTGDYEGHSASASGELANNSTSSALLDFGSQIPSPLVIFLGAVGVAAVGANLLVWTTYFRKKRLSATPNLQNPNTV